MTREEKLEKLNAALNLLEIVYVQHRQFPSVDNLSMADTCLREVIKEIENEAV